jgi:hypothetical protein
MIRMGIGTRTNAGRIGVRKSMLSMSALLIACFIAALPVTCCPSASSAPPSTRSTASTAKQIPGAKAAVRRMSQAKTPGQMAQCLTNESAAIMGAMIAMPLMMQYSMPNAGASNVPRHKKAEQARFEAVLKRYGLDKAQNKGPESKEWRRFAAQGRHFLTEIDGFLARSGKSGRWTKNKMAPSPDALRYTVLDPARVAIRNPKKPKDSPMQARFEDGRWRLHLPLDGR